MPILFPHSTVCASVYRFLPALTVCASLIMPCADAAKAAPAPTVAIEKFAFTPNELTVAPGTRVVWTNRDETPHAISSKDKSLVSKALDTSDAFEHTFSSEGDYAYYCTLHPFMTGIVHVRKQ